jgi:predicted alpha/beta-hydrolase family hydrolase
VSATETATDVPTPHGPARVHVHRADDPVATVVLGHGAGGGVAARDLLVVKGVALADRCSVVLVEQPYRVAGRRSPGPAAQLDAAWTAVLEHLRGDVLGDLALVVGGRSSGARVACRTAACAGARAVLCLAFPVHPPGRPEKTRLGELDAVALPTLVVQGDADPFGMPPPAPNRVIAAVAGSHSLTSDLDGVAAAVRDWLPGVLAAP